MALAQTPIPTDDYLTAGQVTNSALPALTMAPGVLFAAAASGATTLFVTDTDGAWAAMVVNPYVVLPTGVAGIQAGTTATISNGGLPGATITLTLSLATIAAIPAGTQIFGFLYGNPVPVTPVPRVPTEHIAGPLLYNSIGRGRDCAVALGDSRINNCMGWSSGTRDSTAVDFMGWAAANLHQRFQWVANFGGAGQRTDQFLTRLPQALEMNAGLVFMIGHINDNVQGVAFAPIAGGSNTGAATVVAGGTGWTTGQVATLVGGTLMPTSPASTYTVTASAGVVTALTLLTSGVYYTAPSGTLSLTGTGTGLTATVATGNSIATIPAGVTSLLVAGTTTGFAIAQHLGLAMLGMGQPYQSTVATLGSNAVTVASVTVSGSNTILGLSQATTGPMSVGSLLWGSTGTDVQGRAIGAVQGAFNLCAAAASCIAAGALPILTLDGYATANSVAQTRANAAANSIIRAFAEASPDVNMVDYEATLNNITTATPTVLSAFGSPLSADGVHPSSNGAQAFGLALATVMDKLVTAYWIAGRSGALEAFAVNPLSLLDNGSFLSIGGGTAGAGASGTVPNQWTVQVLSGTATVAVVVQTRTDGLQGNEMVLTITGSAGQSRIQIYHSVGTSPPRVVPGAFYRARAYFHCVGGNILEGIDSYQQFSGTVYGTHYAHTRNSNVGALFVGPLPTQNFDIWDQTNPIGVPANETAVGNSNFWTDIYTSGTGTAVITVRDVCTVMVAA